MNEKPQIAHETVRSIFWPIEIGNGPYAFDIKMLLAGVLMCAPERNKSSNHISKVSKVILL